MDRILVAIHFGTQSPSREWMICIAGDLDGFSFNGLYQKTVGIRTVVRTDRTSNLFQQENLRGLMC